MSAFYDIPERNRRYVCRECGKSKLGNYFISETLCKKCAAKRRVPKSNEMVSVTQDIIVTERVRERLISTAEHQVPFTIVDYIAHIARILAIVALLFALFTKAIHGFRIGTLLALAIFFYFIIYLNLSKQRRNNISAKVGQLAEIRRSQIEEREQFYSSAEWQLLRNQVLAESTHICNNCGRKIRKARDVTVDHIKPRSKYPDLSLKRENLMVLCRSCNSSKGANE